MKKAVTIKYKDLTKEEQASLDKAAADLLAKRPPQEAIRRVLMFAADHKMALSEALRAVESIEQQMTLLRQALESAIDIQVEEV